MIQQVDFEFDIKLSNGSLLSVVGSADVLINCDCPLGHEFPHAHIEDLTIEDVVPMYDVGAVDGPDPRQVPKLWREIELKAEGKVYGMLDAA